MKIVIFGVGGFYQERKKRIPPDIEIVAFLDNNPQLQGKYMDGSPIISPWEVREIIYDKIVLMSTSEEAMKEQLLEIGIEKGNIWYWEYFISEMLHGTFKLYCGNMTVKNGARKILIISTDLDYNGGSMAAVYAARALQEMGNMVMLAAPDGNRNFINEMIEDGDNFVICPALPYIHKEEKFWIQQFDVVLVNVFQMISCACEISKIKPVMWWIHEPSDFYDKVLRRFSKYNNMKQLEAINIYAVSNIAQKNFNTFFPNRIKKTLSYGIPDKRRKGATRKITDHLTFAIIGAVSPVKAQHILFEAIELLNAEEKINVRFWVIGGIGEDDYGNQIKRLALKDRSIKITGILSRDEICKVYEEVDVIICPSFEETMSMVVTEGMMYGKTCIVSDKSGITQYIKDGGNGLICKAGDPVDLCEKLRWTIHNQDKLQEIGDNARKIYQKYFSMESFGKRLENALQDTIVGWNFNT